MLPGPSTHLLTVADDHGAPLVEFTHYPDQELLYVRWHGPLSAAEILRGVGEAGRWRHELRYTRVLDDNTDAGGDWSEALPWLQYEWLPQAVAAGIRAVAYVFSPGNENRFVSEQFLEILRPHLAVESFEDSLEAHAWLLRQA